MSRFFDLVSRPARDLGIKTASLIPPPAEGRPRRLIKLDSNENPFGPSARAVEAMKDVLATSNLYPDDDCSQLRYKLATHHNVQPEQTIVTAGSTALLALLCQTLLAPGLNAVTSERSFVVYAMAVQGVGARLIEAPMRENSFDLEAVLGAIDLKTRLVFIANPNNPTGTMLESAEVDRFLERLPGHVIAVVDEAYYEFAQHFAALRHVKYSNSLGHVRQGANVVVLRTFSKAHGLAGLRIGYGFGPAELLAYCARMRSTFSVSSAAQAAAGAAIDDHVHVQRVVDNNTLQAVSVAQALAGLGYRVVPTSANFLYCDLGEDASTFASRLQEEGVAVRPLAGWGASNCIRVTIGTPEQNLFLMQAMRKVTAGATAKI